MTHDSEPEIDFLADGKFRFCIVDSDGRQCSSDWVIWESAKSLYVAVVGLGGVMKLSFHPRGTSNDLKDTQFSTTKTYWKKIMGRGFDGALPFHRWQRPECDSRRASQAMSITFAANCLKNRMEVRELSRKKVGFKLPKSGHAVELSIFFHILGLEEAEKAFTKHGFIPLVDFELSSEERAAIAVREIESALHIETALPEPTGIVLINDAFAGASQLRDLHAIAIIDWPDDGQPLQLAEINGFSLMRRM